MKIPKKWKDGDGRLHHLVNQISDSLSGEKVVISKTWRSRYQCWNYHAAKAAELTLELDFWRKVRKQSQ